MSVRHLAALAALAAVVACGDDPSPVVVTGEWVYRLTTLPDDSACVMSEGNLLFGQSGRLLTGAVYHRAGACLASPNGTLTNGTSDGGVITFETGQCTLTGSSVALDSISGTGTCDGRPAAWSAARVGLASRIAVRPGDRYLVAGDTQPVTALLMDGQNRPMYGRFISWSSTNSAVATVTSLGVVAAVAPGAVRMVTQSGGIRREFQINVERVTFAGLTAGAFHTCGVTAAGASWCWGQGEAGELGDGDAVSGDAPVGVRGTGTFSSVSAGAGFTCGVREGQAYCWGGNAFQRLGTTEADNVAFPFPVTGVALGTVVAGGNHACGLTAAGAAYCWGDNRKGELGNGTRTGSAAPVAVTGGQAFTTLSASGHTCGLTAAGAAYCWGDNLSGQLGTGATDAQGATAPAAVSGALAFQRIATGGQFSCGLTTAGTAYCWGGNGSGQLGNGGGTNSPVPVAVSGARTYVALAAGQDHACAVETGGQLYCWGANQFGQLGDGTTTGRTVPVPVSAGMAFTAIAAGARHSCGLGNGGLSYCWGDNVAGQLGDGTNVPRLVPTRVLGQP